MVLKNNKNPLGYPFKIGGPLTKNFNTPKSPRNNGTLLWEGKYLINVQFSKSSNLTRK